MRISRGRGASTIITLGVGAAFALLAIAPTEPAAAQRRRNAARRAAGKAEISWWPVRKNIWMPVGAGANIAASVGPDGVFLVNAGEAGASDRVLAAIQDLQSQLNAFGFLDVRAAEKG